MTLLGALFFATACSDPGCGNTVLQDLPSPDGRRHIVIFARACGATTDFSTQVSILTSPRTVTGGGNAFIADTDHGKVASGRGGRPAVLGEWVDARTVRIRYPTGARVFKQEARHDDTNIVYVVSDTLTSR